MCACARAPAARDAAAADAAPAAGTVALFDGRTLAGWTETGGRYAGDADWTVEDGAITGRQGAGGEGGLLYTERSYAAFDLSLEVRIEPPIDSGIFVRMVPDARGAQVTIDAGGGELGGIYSDGWLLHNPDGWERFRAGAWNRLEVSARGPDERAFLALDVRLGGEPLVSHVIPPNAVGFAPEGRIGLQVHGGQDLPRTTKVQFKDVRLREVAPELGPESFVRREDGLRLLSARGWSEGWRPLFDGRSLEGWELAGGEGGVTVEDGAIVIASGPGGELRTREDYGDFELVLEFAASDLANSGVFLRASRDGKNPAYSGSEVQILDDANWERATGSTLQPWQFTGSLYGAVPPSTRGALKPSGAWNEYRIRFEGARLAVELNGVPLYDVDTHALAVEPRFADRAKEGFLGLQRHGAASGGHASTVRFRNLFVRRLGR